MVYYLNFEKCQGNKKISKSYMLSVIFRGQFLHWQNDNLANKSSTTIQFGLRNMFYAHIQLTVDI